MNWQDKMKRVKDEEALAEETRKAVKETERRQLREEQEKEFQEWMHRIGNEQQHKAMQVLTDLRVNEKLKEIRDEVWGIGNIETTKGVYQGHRKFLGNWDSDKERYSQRFSSIEIGQATSGYSAFVLCMECPEYTAGATYLEGPHGESAGMPTYHHNPAEIGYNQILLGIFATQTEKEGYALKFDCRYLQYAHRGHRKYDTGKFVILLPDQSDPKSKIDNFLAKDCINRKEVYSEVPYEPIIRNHVIKVRKALETDSELRENETAQKRFKEFLSKYSQFR